MMIKAILSLVTVLILLIANLVYPMDLEKIEVYEDNGNLVIKIYGEGKLPKEFESVIKDNIDVKVVVSVKLLRRDFKPLNITTEITNYSIVRQISYDLITESFLLFDGVRFRLISSLDEVSKNIFPLIVNSKVDELTKLPDFYPIYEDTDFVVVAKMRIYYLDLKPPLSIIASILNLGVSEGRDVYSNPFLIK